MSVCRQGGHSHSPRMLRKPSRYNRELFGGPVVTGGASISRWIPRRGRDRAFRFGMPWRWAVKRNIEKSPTIADIWGRGSADKGWSTRGTRSQAAQRNRGREGDRTDPVCGTLSRYRDRERATTIRGRGGWSVNADYPPRDSPGATQFVSPKTSPKAFWRGRTWMPIVAPLWPPIGRPAHDVAMIQIGGDQQDLVLPSRRSCSKRGGGSVLSAPALARFCVAALRKGR